MFMSMPDLVCLNRERIACQFSNIILERGGYFLGVHCIKLLAVSYATVLGPRALSLSEKPMNGVVARGGGLIAGREIVIVDSHPTRQRHHLRDREWGPHPYSRG